LHKRSRKSPITLLKPSDSEKISRIVFSAHFGMIFIWLTGMYFHGALDFPISNTNVSKKQKRNLKRKRGKPTEEVFNKLKVFNTD
jgi:Photosystem I psaA/psaB protein